MAGRPNKSGRKGPASTGSGGGAGVGALGGLLGGGGATEGYDEAAGQVADGVLSSPGEGYDPRAATSDQGVLTPEMQKAYDQGPFQPLNWFGKLTGQPDRAGAFHESAAISDRNRAANLAEVPLMGAAKSKAEIAATNAASDNADKQTQADLDAWNKQTGHNLTLAEYKGLGAIAHQQGYMAALANSKAAEASLPLIPQFTRANQLAGIAKAGNEEISNQQDTNFRTVNPDVIDADKMAIHSAQAIGNDTQKINNARSLAQRALWNQQVFRGGEVVTDNNLNPVAAISEATKPKAGFVMGKHGLEPGMEPGVNASVNRMGGVAVPGVGTVFPDAAPTPDLGLSQDYGQLAPPPKPAPVRAGLTPSFSRAAAPLYDASMIGVNPPMAAQPWPTPMAMPAGPAPAPSNPADYMQQGVQHIGKAIADWLRVHNTVPGPAF